MSRPARCEITACEEPATVLVPAYNPPHLQCVPDMWMCDRHARLAANPQPVHHPAPK